MNADVIVRDMSRVDQAADHNTRTAEPAAGVLLLADEVPNRPAAKCFNRGQQCFKARAGLSRCSRTGVIRLASIRV
jgi:hypothetical protein